MKFHLRMTASQHIRLRNHLYPGDGLEAVALALCGRLSEGKQHWLHVYEIHPVPYEHCHSRTPDRVTWATTGIEDLLRQAARKGLALLKVHSHPGGFAAFSSFDDESDQDLFSSVHGWLDDDLPHASAIMLPDGRLFGRAIDTEERFYPVERIAVIGDDLHFWDSRGDHALPEFTRRHGQAFGKGTTRQLLKLRAAVVGCSGTGSPIVEMLARLGIGELMLVDPDVVEEKNLNRIINATLADALAKRPKVEAVAAAINRIGLGTKVIPISRRVDDPEVVRRVATCDVVFGCVDSIEGRDTLNALATFYLLPYFDLGVRLDADGQGGIDSIFGTVHYLKPGGSSLRSRGVYSSEDLHAEHLRRVDPEAYRDQRDAGYLVGVQENSPAVVSVNTQLAAMAVNEFLARLRPYRDDPNADYAVHRFSLNQGCIYKEPDGAPDIYLARLVGRGDARPLLNMPRLSETEDA